MTHYYEINRVWKLTANDIQCNILYTLIRKYYLLFFEYLDFEVWKELESVAGAHWSQRLLN